MFKKLILFFLLLGCTSVSKKELSEIHTQIGIGYLNVGNYPAAFRELQNAKALDSTNPEIYNNLGIVCYYRKRYLQSVGFLSKAIKLKPDYSAAKSNLARTYIEMKKYKLANSLLKEVVDDLQFSSPEQAHDYLGLMYFRQKMLDKAIFEFRKAIELNNKYCPAWYNYSVAQYKNKNFKETSRSIDLYISMCNVFDEALYYGGLSYYKSGNNKASRKFLRNLIKNYPNSRHRNVSAKILNRMKPKAKKTKINTF